MQQNCQVPLGPQSQRRCQKKSDLTNAPRSCDDVSGTVDRWAQGSSQVSAHELIVYDRAAGIERQLARNNVAASAPNDSDTDALCRPALYAEAALLRSRQKQRICSSERVISDTKWQAAISPFIAATECNAALDHCCMKRKCMKS